FFFSSRRRHTRFDCDWSSDVCSSDLPAKKIAEFAESAGLKSTVGSNLELGVGSAAMVHLAMATRGITAEEFPCDIIGPFYYEDDIVREPLDIKPGRAQAAARPGLGVELDDQKVKRYRVKDP